MRSSGTYDVVVVGGGAAGCVVASRLATSTGCSVLLLEAGPDFPDPAMLPEQIRDGAARDASAPGSPYNWGLRGLINDQQGEAFFAQAKVIGGGSSINGQHMQRGFPDDFDSWAAMGNDEWSYGKVLPFFRKSETDIDFQNEYHGSDGPMPIRRRLGEPLPALQEAFHGGCLELGFPECPDKNGPDPSGIGLVPSNSLAGVRVSTAMAYLDPARHLPNLAIRGDSLVTRVIIENGRTVGVEAVVDGEPSRFDAERVVLSAGALRTPQLLMLSGVGPVAHLLEMGIDPLIALPGVGQNLWNHMNVHAAVIKVKPDVAVHGGADSPNLQLHFTEEGSAVNNAIRMWVGPLKNGRDDYLNEVDGLGKDDHAARVFVRVGLPESAGYVRLRSADPSNHPWFNFRYLSHPNDLRCARHGVRVAMRVLESDSLKAVSAGRMRPDSDVVADDDALNAWMRSTVTTARHVSGTCRMGPPTDSSAVVDQYCRVRGVAGLWVVDASVMPHIPRSGGVHATVIMIGERVVEWIARG